MEFSSFFNAELVSGAYDRVYQAEDFAKYFASFVGNGVYMNTATNLQVTATGTDMKVSVARGKAWINGYFYESDTVKIITVAPAPATNSRIDTVVVRLDLDARKISTVYVEGAPAANPQPTDLTRTDAVYDIQLAQIKVGAGVTAIGQANITDMRLDGEFCGAVTGAVDQFDATNLFAQYQAAFEEWFEGVQSQLAGDVAGNLQNQINTIKNDYTIPEETGVKYQFTVNEVNPYGAIPANKFNVVGLYEEDAYKLLQLNSTHIVGQYAYAYKGKVAYKIDLNTMSAQTLVDLSSKYPGSSDTIVCVDENNIYFARHTVSSGDTAYGTMIKLTHTGTVVKETAQTEGEWSWDKNTGFQGSSSYTSAFSNNYPTIQTKNYFAVIPYSSSWSTSYYRTAIAYIFKKSDCSFVGTTRTFYIYYTAAPSSIERNDKYFSDYDNDVVFINGHSVIRTLLMGSKTLSDYDIWSYYIGSAQKSTNGNNKNEILNISNGNIYQYVENQGYTILRYTSNSGGILKYTGQYLSSDTIFTNGLDMLKWYNPVAKRFEYFGTNWNVYYSPLKPVDAVDMPNHYEVSAVAKVGDSMIIHNTKTNDMYNIPAGNYYTINLLTKAQ